MTLIAGIDISTKRLDTAIISLDPQETPQLIRLRHATLEDQKDATPLYRRVHRARHLRHPLQYLLSTVTTPHGNRDITLAYIECPRGAYRNDALTGLFDAITATIPPRIQVSGVDPMEWRRILGIDPRITKEQATVQASWWISQNIPDWPTPRLNQHEADALLISLAGRTENTAAVPTASA